MAWVMGWEKRKGVACVLCEWGERGKVPGRVVGRGRDGVGWEKHREGGAERWKKREGWLGGRGKEGRNFRLDVGHFADV